MSNVTHITSLTNRKPSPKNVQYLPTDDAPFSSAENRISVLGSNKLYGRDDSRVVLTNAFNEAHRGACLTVDVTGFSGVGKTSLIQSCLPGMVKKGGRLACGKFDQLKSEHPLQGVVQAFTSLVRQLLCEPPFELNWWKQKIQNALNDNASVLIDVIPQLQLIIGPQPDVPSLDSQQVRNRFIETFRKFISVFTGANHVLVLFVDDLQWADNASIDFLREMVCDNASHHLLFIAAYRSNEVDASHYLNELLSDIQKTKRLLATIHLDGLQEAHVQELLVDTFGLAQERAVALADLCHQKTDGNPFFLKRLLQTLCDDGAIRYDESDKTWTYNIFDIERRAFSENVAALLIHRLKQLPESTRQLLRLAGGIGMQFPVMLLARIRHTTIDQTIQELWPAMKHGLIEVQSGMNRASIKQSEHLIFRFSHDRIQAATHSMWPDSDIADVHLNICNAFLSVYGSENSHDHLFDIADQAALAISRITSVPKRCQFAKIFSEAAAKAIGTGAFLAARRYCEHGISLLSKEAWQQHYAIALELNHRLAEALYLSADFELAHSTCEQALAHHLNHIDRGRFHIIQIRTFFAQGELKSAIDLTLETLAVFGKKIKKECSNFDLFIQHLSIKWLMARRGVKGIGNMQASNDAETVVLGTLYAESLIVAYRSYPKLFPVLILHFVRDIFSNPAMALTPLAVSSYAVLVTYFFNDLNFGQRLSNAAIDACKNKGFETFKGRCEYCHTVALLHRKATIQVLISRMEEAFKSCDNVGDTEWGTLMLYQKAVYRYFSGEPLQTVEEAFADYEPYLFRHGHQMYGCYHQIYRQAIANLTCCEKFESRLSGAFMNEEIVMTKLTQMGDLTAGVFLLHMHKLILCYLKGDLERALFHADEVTPLLKAAGGHFCVGVISMYMSLVRLSVLTKTPGILRDKAKQMLKQVGVAQKRLNAWAKDAPHNYRNKYVLVEALRHQYLNKPKQARALFVEAINLARANHFVQEEALANELAGEYFLSINMAFVGRAHIEEALNKYAQWGAIAKTTHLKQKFASLFDKETIDYTQAKSAAHLKHASIHRVLDAVSLFHNETENIEALVWRIETVFRKQWDVPVAILRLDKGWRQSLSDAMPPNAIEDPPFPQVLEDYVRNEKKPISTSHPDWKTIILNDTYMVKPHPAAAMCVPFICRDRFVGCIYLAHPAQSHIFDNVHADLLRVFGCQAASALEFARIRFVLEQRKLALQQQMPKEFEASTRAQSGTGGQQNLSLLDEASAMKLKSAILDLMESRKLYRDPELSLELLAKQSQSQPRQVSEVINVCLKKNFYRLINDYRIAEAKQRLEDSSEKQSIFNIAKQAGFSSKSSFNSFFKEVTGHTPSNYRKQFRK
ncbi:MAG: AAA family ATPase [Deltaproteobacteria bacterium]|nr:AAA family ATPase [Deltaproteobacteria bacterium]